MKTNHEKKYLYFWSNDLDRFSAPKLRFKAHGRFNKEGNHFLAYDRQRITNGIGKELWEIMAFGYINETGKFFMCKHIRLNFKLKGWNEFVMNQFIAANKDEEQKIVERIAKRETFTAEQAARLLEKEHKRKLAWIEERVGYLGIW